MLLRKLYKFSFCFFLSFWRNISCKSQSFINFFLNNKSKTKYLKEHTQLYQNNFKWIKKKTVRNW